MADERVHEGYGVVYAVKPQFTCGFLSPLSGIPPNVHFKLSPDVLRPEEWGETLPRQNQHVWFSAVRQPPSQSVSSNTPWTCTVVSPAYPVEGVFVRTAEGALAIRWKDQLFTVTEDSWPAQSVTPAIKHQDPEPGDHALFLSGDNRAFDVRLKAVATVKEVNANAERAYMYVEWIKKKNTPVFYWFRSKEEAKFWKKGMRAYFEPYNFKKEGETTWRLQGRCACYATLGKVTRMPSTSATSLGQLEFRVGSETRSYPFDASVLRHSSRVKVGSAVFLNIGSEESKDFAFGVMDVWPLSRGVHKGDGLILDSETKEDVVSESDNALGSIRLQAGDPVDFFLEEDVGDTTNWAVNVRLSGPLVGTVKDRISASRPVFRVTLHPDQRSISVLFAHTPVTTKSDIEFSVFWDFNAEEYVAKDVKKLAALPAVPPAAASATVAKPISPPTSVSSSSASIAKAASPPAHAQAPVAVAMVPPPQVKPSVVAAAFQENVRPILLQLVARLAPSGANRITDILIELHPSNEELMRLMQDPQYLTSQTVEAMRVYEAELRSQISVADPSALAQPAPPSAVAPVAPGAPVAGGFMGPPANHMQALALQLLSQQAAQLGTTPEALLQLLLFQALTPAAPGSPPNPNLAALTSILGLLQPQQASGMMPGMFGLPQPSFGPLVPPPAAAAAAASVVVTQESQVIPSEKLEQIDAELSYFPTRVLHSSTLATSYEALRKKPKSATPEQISIRIYNPKLVNFESLQRMVAFTRKHSHPNLAAFLSEPKKIKAGYAVAMDHCPQTLRAYLKANAAELTRESRKKLASQMLAALQFLHSSDYVVKDMNPDCIFILNENLVMCDLGLANESDAASLSVYAAPELASGRAGTPQDIFSLGCCLGDILGDSHPLVSPNNEGTIAEHLLSGTMPGVDALEELDPAAFDLIRTCINADDDQRPSAFALSRHIFFWSPEKIESFLARVCSLLERDETFYNMVEDASTVVLPESAASSGVIATWRSSIDPALLLVLDNSQERGGEPPFEDSLVGLALAFYLSLRDAATPTRTSGWPTQLYLRYAPSEDRSNLTQHFIDAFPRLLTSLLNLVHNRKRQLEELLPLYTLEEEEEED